MKAGVIIFFTFLTVTSCSLRRFLDCNGGFECPDIVSPICGTDGHTYGNQCHMDMENKRRICWIGHFNMVMKVKDGPCDVPTSTPSVH
ncbi:serine protease inhibitor Kazal-type 1-like [Ruditapes philippinarum]|uniref:serine protease inhibitor Kazal-type 1-like n=1 Tax=Ruditapes philippinarum TaxID=129788 RepID=UPI00295AF4A6|nr:serine protease inhibitor Kazal-type 1-like [Ruditapes philippinarum]